MRSGEGGLVLPVLDPLLLMIFVATFLATALATARRPSYGTAALAFIFPFTFAHSIAGTTLSLPKMVLLGVFAGLLPRASQANRYLREASPVTLALGAVLVCTALTFAPAAFHVPVIRETLKWTEYLLVFALAFVSYRLDPDDTLVTGAFGASIAVVCLSALAQERFGSGSVITFGHGLATRIAGFLEGPNQLGGYLEVALAFAASVHVSRPRAATAGLLALIGLCLPLTFSRGAMIGALVATLTVAIIVADAWRRLVPLYAGIGLGLLGDAVWIRAAETLPSLRNLAYGRDNAGGVGHRAELWRAAWYFFRRHPLLGIGAGNYQLRLSEAGLFGVRTHANNWYLQSLAEGGIVLFGATIALLVTILRQLLRVLRRSPFATAAFAATIALAVHQLADYLVFYPKVAEPWLLLVALGLAAPRSAPCD